MKYVEKTGRTVDSAITDALIELGATTDEVEIEVLEKGSKGIFGLGAKYAKVKVTIKENIETPIKEEQVKEVIKKDIVEEVVQPTIKKKEVTTEMRDKVVIAEQFLLKLLKEMGIEGNLDSIIGDNNRVQINIAGENMGMIIGKRGETLDALQYLTNIVINKGSDDYIKVMIDTENYRSRREETLTKLAFKLAKKASQTRRPVILEPMNPYDRRIIHSALQNSKTVKTHSEGKEPFRKVVITPQISNRSYK